MHIVVNGVDIGDDAISRETQYHPADTIYEAREAAARALVVKELLRQEADRLGIPDDPDTALEARIQALIEQEIQVPDADPATCRRYYENQRQRFRSPDLFEVSHILVAASADDLEAWARARDTAEALIHELQDDPDRFAELARRCSDCPSRELGGNLGQIGKGQTVPEFEQVVFRLGDGELCPQAVETRYGFHVVRANHHVRGEVLPFEAVAEKVARYLRDRSFRRAVHQYLQVLAGRAKITGMEFEGVTTPLVQ